MDNKNGLAYQWVATYKDGSSLKQFEGDKEHMFSEIDQDNLIIFSVEKLEGKNKLSVDLRTGVFYLNDVELAMVESNGDTYSLGKRITPKDIIKLIYFRRVIKTLNAEFQEIGAAKILHFIGWEGIINGKREKWEIAISNTSDEIIAPPRYNFNPL